MVDFITDAFDLQKRRADLSTPSQTILDSRERTRKSIDKHNMFTKGFALLTGTSPGARVEYPTYGTSSKSQSAAIDKQINIDFMQAVDKIYKERGRLTEDELMTIWRAYNAGPAQYKILKEMMPFIGIDRKEVAEQEVAASEARGAAVYDEISTEHLPLIRDASTDTVHIRLKEALYDLNKSNLPKGIKNAKRKEFLEAASKAYALGKSTRDEARTERKELAEQEVSVSKGRVSDIINKVLSKHRPFVVEADPEFVANRIGEAVFDIDNSNLSGAEKNAARKEVVDRLQKAANISKTGREGVRAEIGEKHRIADRTQKINKDNLALAKAAREASENKTEQLLIYNALKELDAAIKGDRFLDESTGVGFAPGEEAILTPFMPGITLETEQKIISKYSLEAANKGLDQKKVADAIRAAIVTAPSTKPVFDLQAKSIVLKSDREIAQGNDRFVPVQNANGKLSAMMAVGAALAMGVAMEKHNIGEGKFLDVLDALNKLGPHRAMMEYREDIPIMQTILNEASIHLPWYMQRVQGGGSLGAGGLSADDFTPIN